jgi:hypothetical protein
MMFDKMATDFSFMKVTDELAKLIGKPDKGTHIYRRGSFDVRARFTSSGSQSSQGG